MINKLKKKENLSDRIANEDVEAAFIGAMMRETGRTEINGIDYRLRKSYCEEQLEKHNNNMEEFMKKLGI